MARKSRKNITVEPKKSSPDVQTFSTAIYVRLSIENSGKDDNGDSIENQTDICREYVEKKPYLELCGVYSDNGEKGWKFDRPEFTRLMEDVKSHRINCIVVKDLSRFGRDYIETGNYLEKIFPFLGVRFISVTDNFDSFTCGDAEKALMIPLKNMVNDAYAKDISRKILTTFRQRQEKGEILLGHPPYGYRKSETESYHYEVDREVAPYVKMMFEWKADGISVLEIARRLDRLGAPAPSVRKVQLGIYSAANHRNTRWRDGTINRLLTNPVYTGAMVYGRYTASLYEGVRHHLTKSDEWKVIEGMHEAIISRELFERVQDVFKENKRKNDERYSANAEKRKGVNNRFEGKVFCGDCGKKMRFFRAEIKSTGRFAATYDCNTYRYRAGCSLHHTRMSVIEDAVLAAISAQFERAREIRRILSSKDGDSRRRTRMQDLEKENIQLRQELAKVNKKRVKIYEDFVSAVIDEDEYRYAKKEYDGRSDSFIRRLEEIETEKDRLNNLFNGGNPWLDKMSGFTCETELTDKMIDTFIKEIRVFEGHRIEVLMNYSDEADEMERVVRELEV